MAPHHGRAATGAAGGRQQASLARRLDLRPSHVHHRPKVIEHRNGTQPGRIGDTYLFIDGNYLTRRCSDAASAVLGERSVLPSVAAIKRKFRPDKVFYYDSVDDRPARTLEVVDGRETSRQETGSEAETRSARLSAFLDRTDELDDVHVIRGTVTGRDGNRRQKEVDVRLAVDAIMHATRRNMRFALLLAGDRDFRPAVRGLVELGVNVTVLGHERVSRHLRAASDRFRVLRVDDLLSLVDPTCLSSPTPELRVDFTRPRSDHHKPSDIVGSLVDHSGASHEVREIGRDSRFYTLQVTPGLTPDTCAYFECASPGSERAREIVTGMVKYQFGASPTWA